MDKKKLYESWLEKKSQVEINESFPGKVMNQICQYEQDKLKPLLDIQWFFDFVSTNPLARLALFVSGGLLGLARIILIMYPFFGS